MKQVNSQAIVFLVGISICSLIGGCSKDAAARQSTAPGNKTLKMAEDDNNLAALSTPAGILGAYTVQDEKTVYKGQANPKGNNVLIHLDFINVPTNITTAPDKKHLTMPYGAAAYADSGWTYLIGYNAATKATTLAPNDAMINDIVPNSFEVLLAVYDSKTKQGSFITRFTALKDKGNETELSETFFK